MARGKAKAKPDPLRGFLAEIGDQSFDPDVWTDMQIRFALGLIRHGNATRAYREAGYRPSTPGTEQVAAYRLKHLPHIMAFVAEKQKEARDRLALSAQRVLDELAKVAFFNMADVIEITPEGGAKLTLEHVDADTLAAIGEFTIEENAVGVPDEDARPGENVTISRKIKFKPLNKLDALDKLGRHFKLFTDRLELDAKVDIAGAITAARARRLAARKAAEEKPDDASGDAD